MRHLFIVNPQAGNVDLNEILSEIHSFFYNYPVLEEYTIHVTRWKRDSVGYIRRFVNLSREMTRVYAVGGAGTLFEVVNGAMGLPNVQVAFYPAGKDNSLLYSFGESTIPLFKSLKNLIYSQVRPLDILRAGKNFCIQNCLVGCGAETSASGHAFSMRTSLPRSLGYRLAAAWLAITNRTEQEYAAEIDGQKLDGRYISMMVANAATYGDGWLPAAEARMNDSFLDFYLINRIPKHVMVQFFNDYNRGNYAKWPELVSHIRGKKITLSSPEYISFSMDGELVYDTAVDIEIEPRALDFVLPEGVEL